MLRKTQQGITLLEALVALSIFAVIGAASYQVLAAVINAQEGLAQTQQQLARQQTAMRIIERDIRQLVVRDVRQADGDSPYLSVEQDRMAFTRGGLSNPLNQTRSQLQRLSYDIGTNPWQGEAGHPLAERQGYFLRRVVSSALDAASDNSDIQLLLPAQALEVVVVSGGKRYSSWPPQERNRDGETETDISRPEGIEITLVLASGESLSRWLQVF